MAAASTLSATLPDCVSHHPARRLRAAFLACALTLVLAACATSPVPSGPASVPPPSPDAAPTPAPSKGPAEPAPAPSRAVDLPLARGPDLPQLPGWTAANWAGVYRALGRSCPTLTRRADPSGLTVLEDWTALCATIQQLGGPENLPGLLAASLQAVIVGDGVGLNTGYFEPELAGARTPSADYAVPLLRRPKELIDVQLGDFVPDLSGQRISGQVEGRTLIPYLDRAAIDGGALAGRGLEMLWVADPYEAFFLHIQGSGRVRLPDGSIVRVGYDGQNGYEYVGIGRVLRERGLLEPGQSTLEGILAWLRANPVEARDVMHLNRSYIFFRELTGLAPEDGAIGAIGVPLTSGVSVAADPQFIPRGAPIWLTSRVPDPANPQRALPLSALMVVQDTGGAIKGPNRLDLFFGAGPAARAQAGAMSQRGATTLLLPRSAAMRLLGPVAAAGQ